MQQRFHSSSSEELRKRLDVAIVGPPNAGGEAAPNPAPGGAAAGEMREEKEERGEPSCERGGAKGPRQFRQGTEAGLKLYLLPAALLR